MARNSRGSEEHILIGKGKYAKERVENLIASMNKYNTSFKKYPHKELVDDPNKRYVRITLQIVINKKPGRIHHYIEEELVPYNIISLLN